MAKNDFDKIKHRVPYGAPKVDHYNVASITIKSGKFEAMIDKRVRQLKRQGVNISECPNYLESIVEEYIANLEHALERKHHSNLRFLTSIFLRRASDKKDFEDLETALDEEIAKTHKEIKLVKMLYEKCNPLYKGKLNLKGVSFDEDEDEDESEESEDSDE